MSKFTNYLFLISGLIGVFWAFGLLEGGTTSTFLNIIINPEQILSAEFFRTLFDPTQSTLYGVLAAAAGIILARYRSDLTIFAAAIPVLISYGLDLIIIFNTVKDINEVFAILVFAPMIVVYVITVAEWWRGVTT